ncbi:MAG TPA: phosphoribosylanthranilate isomerase [Deltaproteobacteria bacterium]|nr:phosphoribosylanthranilate isomerase [Deltaproteobacteria bacterium]
MASVQVKICGLTDLNDTLDAIEFGADYLGFNFYPDSPRFLPYEKAKALFEEIPSNIPKVGVFVNEDIDRAVDLAIELGLDLLQFHGDEPPEALNPLGRPWIKAFRLKEQADLAEIPRYQCEWILVDAYSEKAYGGTGLTAHWDLVREAEKSGKKIILAGGLTPENVGIAVATVKPFMVDVASGVESSPGVKDRNKMEIFISKAKSALLLVK